MDKTKIKVILVNCAKWFYIIFPTYGNFFSKSIEIRLVLDIICPANFDSPNEFGLVNFNRRTIG